MIKIFEEIIKPDEVIIEIVKIIGQPQVIKIALNFKGTVGDLLEIKLSTLSGYLHY